MFYMEVCSHIFQIIEKTNIQFISIAEVWRCSTKSAEKHLCQSLIKLPASSLPIKKAQVFSYEFCEVLKNTFLAEHLRTAVSKAFQCASFNLNNAGFFEGNLQILGFDLQILGRTNSNLKLKLKIC